MTVYAITDTKKGEQGIAPTYLQTTRVFISLMFRECRQARHERYICTK